MDKDNVVDILLGDQISKKLEDRKRNLSILILGHYRPREVLERLEKFRNFLRINGYPGTKLLKDIPDTSKYSQDDDAHFLLKSEFHMQFAEIILFVLFKEGEKSGPEMEFAYLCNTLRGRCWRCAVFCEESYKNSASSMLKGHIKITKMLSRCFKDDIDLELYDASLGILDEFSTSQYDQLKSNL